jgi:TolB-like protein/class 3 adenylate cyclase/Tfp pilus assembly protein PilF
MTETRKIAAILAADVVGYSRLAGADEDRTLARLRALRSDLIDPTVAVHNGRVVKRTGDGSLIEFRSVVDAVRCAIEVQNGMLERNAGVPPERRIEFRVGIHLGDVVEESDGDLMGDGVNVAARLEGIAKPGAICLSEDAYRQVKARVDLAVSDLGPTQLKNIAEPIRVYSLDVGVLAQAKPVASLPQTAAPPSAPRLSIVVLPFTNIGGDPEQEYFVDGVTESLTTDLSRIAGSFVIARNSAFSYKGKSPDVRQIGRELNVRYVLEGSMQRGGNRLRVNVQLIDAESGNHLWAERFDKPVTDLFDMQDEIVSRLANTLNAQLVAAEARRAEYAPHPSSMDLHFQGMAWINKGPSPEYTVQAHSCFERALALDPGNVEAFIGMASVDVQRGAYFLADDRATRLTAAEGVLSKVLSLAPNHAIAHYLLGHVQIFSDRAAQGTTQCQRALTLDRNLAVAHGLIGAAKYFNGRADETEAHVQEALRLSPRDTNTYLWLHWVGNAKSQLGADEEAVTWFRRGIDANRNFAAGHFFLASALTLLGQIDEARAAAKAGLALDPSFTIRRFRAGVSSDHPAYLAGRERMYDGMRKSGVPAG